MKIKTNIYCIFILTGLLFLFSCAQQGAPSGGPEDLEPPKILKAEPKNYSTNFSSKKILITFDEFLDMGNFTQELVVSPPMEEKPIVKLRNKTLIIEFEEELKEDVTYTFNFGEGIKDLNEQNVLLNFEYVFATGDFLDSLSIKGLLKNAQDLSISEIPILVMLYTELADSIPLTEIPYYVGRTDKEGNFAVNNLKKGIYKIFVLKDANNNFLFDLPSEQIAFLDTSLIVDADYYRKLLFETGVYDSSDLQTDTLFLSADTTGMSADSILMLLDSIEQAKPDFNSIYIDMFMFAEDPVNQFISDYKREKKTNLEIIFNIPISDEFKFKPIWPDTLVSEDFIPEFGQKGDSLIIWLADTMVAKIDTIGLALEYQALDTLGEAVIIYDSLQFVYREKTSKKKTSKKKESGPAPLKVKTISNSGKHHILRDMNFSLETPVKSIDPSLFEMFYIPDTTEIPININPFIDSAHLHRVRIPYKWKEEAQYRMVVYPGAITDIYEAKNDTIDKKFSIRPLADYGRINLTLENVNSPIMIEIYRRNEIFRKEAISSSGIYVFDFMDPDTYRIKFIYDRNENGKWDTGKYLENLQPERVEFLSRDVKVRANWDHDINYVMGTNKTTPKEPDEDETEGL